jgi:hypothetical protein
MTMKPYQASRLTAMLLLLGAAGCRNPLPCTGCEEAADDADADADEPLPDLPCGGADLMTDNLNCGTCGNACGVWYEGTEWQAGGCEQGECSAIAWSGCAAESIGSTCEEICGSRECLPGGCSGLTAMVFETGHFDPCYTSEVDPVLVLKGACDEPIPWEVSEGIRQVSCCCEI